MLRRIFLPDAPVVCFACPSCSGHAQWGRRWYLWLVPMVDNTTDGLTFPVNAAKLKLAQSNATAGQQPPADEGEASSSKAKSA